VIWNLPAGRQVLDLGFGTCLPAGRFGIFTANGDGERRHDFVVNRRTCRPAAKQGGEDRNRQIDGVAKIETVG